MTIHLAIDPLTGIALPTGRIRLHTDQGDAALTTLLGSDASQYTTANQRRQTVDETDDDKWTNDCVPGWYIVAGAVQQARPQTPIEAMRAAFQGFHDALNGATQRLAEAAAWHPQSLVNEAHQWIYWAGHMAAYQVAHNTALTIARRTTWANNSTAIVNAATGDTLYDSIDAANEPTAPVGVVNPANGQTVGFSSPVALTGGDYGNAPAASVLGNGKWIANLSS